MSGWTPINPHPRISDVDVAHFDYATYPWQDVQVTLRPDGKAQLWRQVDSPEDAHLLESQGIWETSRLDGLEGAKSFLEKRPAEFPGKMGDLERFAFWPWWRQADVALYPRGPESMRAAQAKSKL